MRYISLVEDACRCLCARKKNKHFSSRIELRENLSAAIKRADDDGRDILSTFPLNCCVLQIQATLSAGQE